jgi:putative Holliday junction resolvase
VSEQVEDRAFVEVKSFVEKPDVVRAAEYVASGDHHWNTGSFACRVGAFVTAMDAAQPGAMRHLKACAEALANDEDARARESFELVPLVSIDYGLMERAQRLGAISLQVEFDDIGSWDALSEHGGLVGMGESRNGLAVAGVDSVNCAAYGEGSVAFVGCDDLVVVREGDRILVMHRGHGQSVKQARVLIEEERRKAARESHASADVLMPSASSVSLASDARPGVHLGVDYGDARTGIALSDDLGLLASPLELIRERDRALVADRVAALAREHGAEHVVLGMPYNMDGSEGPRALKAREFAALLTARGVASVILHDERLTSWEAEGRLREAGHGGRERKQLLDMAAAVTILEAYLSGLRKASAGSSSRNVEASLSADTADIPWEKPGWQKPGFKRDKLSHDDRRDKNREQRARRKGS